MHHRSHGEDVVMRAGRGGNGVVEEDVRRVGVGVGVKVREGEGGVV